MTQATLDLIRLLGGTVMSVVGLLAVLYLIRGDRARGRRRCPKCWYDLANLPPMETGGWRCPECGYVAAGERDLKRSRRRWGWIAIVAAVTIAGAASSASMLSRGKNLITIVPTRALMWIAPTATEMSATPGPSTLAREARAELEQRVGTARLSFEQAIELMERDLDEIVSAPRKVLIGSGPVNFKFTSTPWPWTATQDERTLSLRSPGDSGRMLSSISGYRNAAGSGLGTFTSGFTPESAPQPLSPGEFLAEVELRLEKGPPVIDYASGERSAGNVLWRKTIRRVVTAVVDPDDIMKPVRDPSLNDLLVKELRIRVLKHRQGFLEINCTAPIDPRLRRMALALRIELRRDGVAVSEHPFSVSCNAMLTPPRHHSFTYHGYLTHDGVPEGFDPLDPTWTLHISGDRDLALRDVEADSYWMGEIEVPLKAVWVSPDAEHPPTR